MPPLMKGQDICGCIPLRSCGNSTGMCVHHGYKGPNCTLFGGAYVRGSSVELKGGAKISLMGGPNPANPRTEVSNSFLPKIFSL